MPYKTEHTARQIQPEEFSDFRRVHENFTPDGIDFVYGIKEDGSSEIQSVRADAELWSLQKFVDWLNEHELTDAFVVPATTEGERNGEEVKEMAKSAASTPAKPSERIKGSKKNKAGSAKGPRGGIQVSAATEKTLKNKLKEHNDEVGDRASKRTTLGALKAVYRRGAGAFSKSHRPGMTRGQWGFARVNAFLHLLKKGKPKRKGYVTDNDLLPEAHPRSSKKKKESSRELGRMIRLPGYIRDALRKGLKLHEDGRSGGGLVSTTVRMATIGAESGEWSEEKIIKAAAWFERHESDRKLKDGRRWNLKNAETPGYVAWLLWGSDANDRGRSWIKKKAAELKEERKEMSQSEHEAEAELGYGYKDEEMGFEPKEGDPLGEYRDRDSTIAPMIRREDVEGEENKDLHVLRLGTLYDLDSGEMIMNMTEDSAREIARTTDRMIQAGHAVPISFEHGIEGGQRAQEGADRRPYGMIMAVYYDEYRRGIYARKQWTKLGKRLLLDSMTEDGRTAVRVSPRVIMKPAYHPSTGERLGESYMDVISLTTLPRQDRMEPVALSRTKNELDNEQSESKIQQPAEPTATTERVEMTEKTTEEAVDVLLARGSEEANAIFTAAGLEDDAPVVELARKFETLTVELARVNEELNKYRTEELNRLAADKDAEVEEFLNSHNVSEVEREFFKISLLSNDEKTAELARQTIIARGEPDKMEAVETALTEAKKRGAVPADFVVEGELAELSRTAPEVAVGIINAIPGENVVRVGDAAGSDAAGVDTKTNIGKEQAGVELSRLARELIADGKVTSLIEAHRMAKIERPDLVAATKEEN
jgi:hypothetical protein